VVDFTDPAVPEEVGFYISDEGNNFWELPSRRMRTATGSRC